jgi:hypothetical protein
MSKPTPRKPRVRIPVKPLAYDLKNVPLPFSRMTFYRWEKLGLIKLLRIASKTLISAETVEDILSGKIELPRNAGMAKPPMSRARRRKAGSGQPAAPAE